MQAKDRLTPAGEKQELVSPREPTAAITIRDLVVAYGRKRAVDGLRFTVPTGAIFGFLGPNGAGKTTTIKTLLGFRRPQSGSAHIFAFDVVRESLLVRARVGYVSETNSLYDFLTIPQLCAFCRSLSQRWDQHVVDHSLRLFELPTRQTVGQFSKGMKSQLALCLALGSTPDLLILDEPTAGLDPQARHEFLNTVVSEVAEEGKTIFFSSHILSEVEAVANWVAIIREGRLVLCDELAHLKHSKKVVRVTYSDLPSASQIEPLRHLPGVLRLTQEGRSVRLVTGDQQEALIQTIQAQSAASCEIAPTDLSLEDLYLETMEESNYAQERTH